MIVIDQIGLKKLEDPEAEPMLWDDILKRAIEIAYDSNPASPLRESCGPLLDWPSILGADEPEKEFQRQLAEILTDDLQSFNGWLKNPSSAGELQDHGSAQVSAFERSGSDVVLRGDLYPLSEEAWRLPLWAATRLLEAGLLQELNWELIPED